MGQLVALLLCIKKVLGSNPCLTSFYMELACSPHSMCPASFHIVKDMTVRLVFNTKTTLGDHGTGVKNSSCNRRVAGSKPSSVGLGRSCP